MQKKLLTKQQASEIIAKYIANAEAEIAKAEEMAKIHELHFRWDGPAYGMGGYFSGVPDEDQQHWHPSSNN
jgi:hypothetical protein